MPINPPGLIFWAKIFHKLILLVSKWQTQKFLKWNLKDTGREFDVRTAQQNDTFPSSGGLVMLIEVAGEFCRGRSIIGYCP